jgi:hypothetical protein
MIYPRSCCLWLYVIKCHEIGIILIKGDCCHQDFELCKNVLRILKCEQYVVIGSKVECHSPKDTQIIMKMVPPLPGEHDGILQMNEAFLGSSNKTQDFECAQEIKELDASHGSIKDIGNGYVLTTTFVLIDLDQLSRLQRRRNGYEHGLVLRLECMVEVCKAHGNPQQFGSSSIQHERHVNQRIWDGQVKVMGEGFLQNLTKTKFKNIKIIHKYCGPYLKPQMKQYMRNAIFTSDLGHEGLNAHWIEVQHVSVENDVEHATQKSLEVLGMMVEQLGSSFIQHDQHVNQRIWDGQVEVMGEDFLENLTKTKFENIKVIHKYCGPYLKPQMKQYMRNAIFATYLGHEGLIAHWMEVKHVSVGKHVDHATQKLLEVYGMMVEQSPARLSSIDVFVKLAKGDVEVSKRLHKEYAIFSLHSKVVACECFEFIVGPLSEWMQLNKCSLLRKLRIVT